MSNAVTLSYKDQIIAELNRPGRITLLTAGKVCETDIDLNYVSRCPRGEAASDFDMPEFFEDYELRGMANSVVAREE